MVRGRGEMNGGGAEENSNESCTAEGGDGGQRKMEKTGHDGPLGSTSRQHKVTR